MDEQEQNKRSPDDRELRELWGDSWKLVEEPLRRIAAEEAPVALKHRLRNREFGRARRKLLAGRLAAAAAGAALCAILAVRSHQLPHDMQPLTDDDVAMIAGAVDGDDAVADLSQQILDNDTADLEDVL